MKVSVIVPVFNEVTYINEILYKLKSLKVKGFNFEFIIVESNSTDGTNEKIICFEKSIKKQKIKNFTFVYQKLALGKGNAVREGIKYVNGDLIMIQDSDLEYDFNDYSNLLNVFINDETIDLVIGKRVSFRNFGNFGLRAFYMNLGQIFFHNFFKLLYFVKLDDPTTMFKIFKKSTIADLEFESNRFDFDWELICKLIRKKVKFKEISVRYDSRGFNDGKKVGLFLDPFIWFYKIIKYRIIKI